MKQKKMTLRNQIFIIMLVQIVITLVLVHLAFLLMIVNKNITTFTIAEMDSHIKTVLFRILILSVTLTAFLSYKVANSISKPISDLSHIAEDMSNMVFTPRVIKCRSSEIDILNKRFNEMANHINYYYKERNAILQNVSHELKTPLMSIHGYAEAVRENIEDDVNVAMNIIIEESERLTEMVNQLLTLSKHDVFIGHQENSNLQIAGEIVRIIKMFEGLAHKKNIKIQYFMKETNVVCCISEDVFRIILSNILSNSLRYAKENICINLTSENNYAIITITDDGGGIDPNRLQHIFERNYTGEGGNYGLGLHIVQSSLEGIEGTVSAQNVKNGCCFTIRIPLNIYKQNIKGAQ